MTTPKSKAFALPPHENAENHQRLMKRWKKMTDEEFLQTLVSAGIYDKKGKLRPPYAGDESPTGKTAPQAKSAAKLATNRSDKAKR